MTPAVPPFPGAASLRVVTVPFGDPYVRAVLPAEVVAVGPAGEPSPWLDRNYLAAHAADVDVLHLHTGYGALPGGLDCWAETLRRLGLPLVATVHRLPAAGEPARADAQLAAVLGTAEVVLTLTTGAADEIARRYGRTAIVVAHPSLTAPVPDLGAERGLVGLPLRADGRPRAGLLRAALGGARSGGGRLRVLAEPGLELPELRTLDGGDAVEVVVAGRAQTWVAQLQELHVAILPEPCGSHSRELELCRDVGTRVVAPACGWFADQWSDVVTYGTEQRYGFDPVSLTGAVAAALARLAPRPADRAWRAEQHAAVRAVHAQVYAHVAADRAWA